MFLMKILQDTEDSVFFFSKTARKFNFYVFVETTATSTAFQIVYSSRFVRFRISLKISMHKFVSISSSGASRCGRFDGAWSGVRRGLHAEGVGWGLLFLAGSGNCRGVRIAKR